MVRAIKSLMIFMVCIVGQYAGAYCSLHVDGFVFARQTSPWVSNVSGEWDEKQGYTFSRNYAFAIIGHLGNFKGESLIYVKYFDIGDKDCRTTVVAKSDIHLFDKPRSGLWCSGKVDGLMTRYRSVPQYKSSSNSWSPYKALDFSKNFDFEIVKTIPLENGDEILVVEADSSRRKGCFYAATLRSQVTLLGPSEND